MHTGDVSGFLLVWACLRERKKHLCCESQHVCVTLHAPSLQYMDPIVCVSFHSLSTLVWMQWDEIGESVTALAGDMRLIWCLFASTLCGTCQLETCTHCDVLRYFDTVCVSKFVLKSWSLWQSSQHTNWFFSFFLHSCATWYTSYFIYYGCQAQRYLRLCPSHPSFFFPPPHCHYSCNLCPCENLDALPGCSK